jgi:hypothetical protein
MKLPTNAKNKIIIPMLFRLSPIAFSICFLTIFVVVVNIRLLNFKNIIKALNFI